MRRTTLRSLLLGLAAAVTVPGVGLIAPTTAAAGTSGPADRLVGSATQARITWYACGGSGCFVCNGYYCYWVRW